jgi:hypothetical protein
MILSNLIVWVVRPDAEEDAMRAVLRRLGRPASRGTVEDNAAFVVGCVVLTAVACIAVWLYHATRPAARVGAFINGRRARPARKGAPQWR